MQRTRQNILLFAEAIDAWRVVPRLMIVSYGYLVFNLYIWYKNIPTYVQEKCDANVLMSLMSKGMTALDAKAYACSVFDVVGGPTAAQSTFVTTIIGLSTGIFGLYTATGRKWPGDRDGNYGEDGYRQNGRRGRDDDYGPPDVGNVTQDRGKTNIQIIAGQPERNGPVAPDIVTAPDDSPRP